MLNFVARQFSATNSAHDNSAPTFQRRDNSALANSAHENSAHV